MNALTQVSRTVAATVAHELGEVVSMEDLSAIQPDRYRTVAGLRMVTNAARDAVVDENSAKRLKGLQRYRADEMMLKARLSAVNITPLATLPLSAWDKLLDMTGLYRFLPDSEGRVAISTKVVDDSLKEAASLKSKWPSTAWCLLLVPVMIATFCYSRPDNLAGSIVAGIAAGVMLSLFLIAFYFSVKQDHMKWTRQEYGRNLIVEKVSSAIKAGTINSLLWPDLTSPEDSVALIKIGLPDPTLEAAEAILAVERTGLPMHLSAVGEAIHLLEDPAKVLLKESNRQIMEELERQLADPIVYVIEGSAVAVIAQYGDFPIEQEVVNEVVNSVHLV